MVECVEQSSIAPLWAFCASPVPWGDGTGHCSFGNGKQNANPTVCNVSDLSHSAFLKGKNSEEKHKFISKDEFVLANDAFHRRCGNERVKLAPSGSASGERDGFDSLEIFEMIRHLNDPEHPLTLEQLHVTTLENIDIDNEKNTVDVRFTPTIPHCSMATLIGLSIRVKLCALYQSVSRFVYLNAWYAC